MPILMFFKHPLKSFIILSWEVIQGCFQYKGKDFGALQQFEKKKSARPTVQPRNIEKIKKS